jgi:hypothetical protein
MELKCLLSNLASFVCDVVKSFGLRHHLLSFFFFLLAVLEFELGASHLLDKHSTA